MLVPLYGFLAGDTLGVMVLVHDTETIADVATKLQQAATVRVAHLPRTKVFSHGRLLDARATVAASGLTALDRVDVVPEDA
jgi:hypothetical protein